MNNKSTLDDYDAILDPRLVQAVRKRVASCRKADFIDVLGSHLLRCRLPLSPQCDVDTVQAFRDAVREDIMLNGVRFVGDHRTEAFVAAVKRIVQKFVPKDQCLEASDRIMRRCSRTHSGTDSYFALQELFGATGLLIKPRPGGTPPLDISLGRDKTGSFKCRISAANLYAIYRHDDIEQLLTHSDHTLAPLVEVDTVIVEVMSFATGATTRTLSLRTPEPQEYLHAEVQELF
ncbi:hypothetical protein SPRG_10929 [Saprolegnia parasitica CBS 223.65]|uniref:Uncharacterized protein n=1 Tax=Saprolegnia parasitica (strain CBS 223.65) TaxID=695850 RepID=A0A067C6D9_SAPPC|nr:hypothetical protein SPRG_10929 [Saprolegnia parasitica CBS 223.65]KDO22111.1 hypothetical protein SPRG_10929 [Saprolegnia parasitica CBS 223.65]|eukprot:XP_012207150.1 hypothetical protein SPRG_10929 [Saprolegnia parasitica CBS 223.65]